MQLHQLRCVVSVAEERRFTRAAARLHVAQPSVSSAVAALEQELGAQLFYRDRSEVSLTGAGEVFLPWARQVLADCEAGAAAVRDLLGLEKGRLVLGATPSLTTNVLPPCWLLSIPLTRAWSWRCTRPAPRTWSSVWNGGRCTWPW
jgi:DNA-binding transcriptional LysR family regulator